MTRADFIRWLAQHYPDLDASGIIEGCQSGGWPEPSRQAVESALAKSGTRGRPRIHPAPAAHIVLSSPSKISVSNVGEMRVHIGDGFHSVSVEPGHTVRDLKSALLDAGVPATVLDMPVRVYTDAFTGAPYRVRVMDDTVATMSQKPRTKRARRTPKAPQSKRKAK